MKINIITSAIPRMISWLLKSKEENIRDEKELREILLLKEYKIEFERYQLKNLPVSNIGYEEAVDFFMNFDKKEFSNPRLEYKRESFNNFYNSLNDKILKIKNFEEFSREDIEKVELLLKNGLPNEVFNQVDIYNVLLIVSIGNSFGWPYKNYIDFDVSNIDYIENKEDFIHLLAHEIHHTMFGYLIKEDPSPQESFALEFSFEGLAVHFCNNADTIGKPSKYKDKVYDIDTGTWSIFKEEHDELFSMFKDDFNKAKDMSDSEVENLVKSHYMGLTHKSLKNGIEYKVFHYPTYYLGCMLWGSIDLVFGKEKLFEVMKNPSTFKDVYNESRKMLGDDKYLL